MILEFQCDQPCQLLDRTSGYLAVERPRQGLARIAKGLQLRPQAGCLILGFLNGLNRVDLEVMRELIGEGDVPWTFHRAIDHCLDLDRASVPQQEYPLKTSMIAVPPGAEVIKVSPSKVTIKLERTAAAALEVRATVQGKPAKGFHVEGVEVEPASVTVQGPESRVRAKIAATTAPVDISGLAQPTVFEADIILPRPELRFVSLQTSARIAVRIVPDKAPARPASRRVS